LSRQAFGLPIWAAGDPVQEERARRAGRFSMGLGRLSSACILSPWEVRMAYDRYDTRDPRGERSRWRDDRFEGRGRDEDRGFFERAGDEIASWFGDDEAERRRREDQRMESRGFSRGRDWRGDDNDRFSRGGSGDRFERDEDSRRSVGGFRGPMSRESYRGYGGTSGYDRAAGRPDTYGERGGRFAPLSGDVGQTQSGDYERGEGFFAGGGYPRNETGGSRWESQRDPHYHSWRQRQIDELDRDYDDYRRENQSRFESEFGSWRERRMQKRSLLGQIREHMEVIGNDDQHVGTVDRLARDRIILTKSDPESGGAHHSISCSDIDRVEGDRVILDCSADQARERWRDENRSRALFEREDQGDMGDRVLNRSFEGTYR
jgi:hypothetical protein